MNKKQYLKYEIKSLLVPLIIFAAIFLTNSMEFILTLAVSGFEYNSECSQSFFVSMVIVPTIFSFVLPIFLYLYRFSKPRLDLYYQVGIDKKYFRRTRFLIGFIGIAAIFSIIYLFTSSLISLGFALNDFNKLRTTYNAINYDVIYTYPSFSGTIVASYFGFYPFFLLSILTNYCICSMLTSFSNNIKDLFIHYICGFVILSLGLTAIPTYIFMTFNVGYENINLSSFVSPVVFSFMPIMPLIYFVGLARNFAYYGYFDINFDHQSINNIDNVLIIIFSMLIIILGICSFLHVFFHKERSGEFANKHGGYNFYTKNIVHITATIISLYITCTGVVSDTIFNFLLIPLLFTSLIAFGGFYYLLLALYNKKWSLDKPNLITMFSVDGFMLTMLLVNLVISSSLRTN